MKKLKKWFTLIELLVAITILWILSTLGITQFWRYFQTARDTVRVSDIESIETAVSSYYSSKSRYPYVEEIKTLTWYINPIPTDRSSGSPFLLPESVWEDDTGTAKDFLNSDNDLDPDSSVTNSPMDYIYVVWKSDNWLKWQVYELSTAFESEDNMRWKAFPDKWDDVFRFEKWSSKIWQRSNIVCTFKDTEAEIDNTSKNSIAENCDQQGYSGNKCLQWTVINYNLLEGTAEDWADCS